MERAEASPDGIMDEIFIGDFDDDGFELERVATATLAPAGWPRPRGGSAAGERVARGKALRAAASVAFFVAVGVALLGGPRVARGLLARFAPIGESPDAAVAVLPPDLIRAGLPVGVWKNPTVRLAPVNGPANAAYACWVDEPGRMLGQEEAPLLVAAFDAGRQTWRTLASPAPQGASCDVAADLAAPGGAVLAVGQAHQGRDPCPLPDLYMTEDGGSTWRAVPWPWPAGAVAACQVKMTLEGGRLYMFGDALGDVHLPGSVAEGASGRFLMTADGGRTWRAADAGLGGVRDFAPLAFRPGGRVLAAGVEPGASNRTGLWESSDAGAHWTRLGRVPGSRASVFVSSDPAATGAGGWGRLYAQATSEGTAIPGEDGAPLWASGAARPAWTPTGLNADGAPAGTWTPLREPTDPGASLVLPTGTWLPDAGEGPGGALLVAQPSLGFQPSATLSLWTGQPSPQRAYLLPQGAVLQGVSWYQGQMRVWATMSRDGLGRGAQVVVFTLRSQS